ncbi:ABC transporter permease [Halorussus sp. AFM4]|uniref:ABC transporter permease n=1 Tax=Halorussus sp. AFM4 TaxID=3421651 RepID=UPI003EBF0E5E
MNGALVVSRRLLLGLRGDRRTLGLVLVVPGFIVFLFGEVFPRPEPVAPVLLAVFVFFLTYLLTAVGFLREQTAGTLERVLVSPISRSGLVLGYVVGFGLLAAVQSAVLLGASVYFLDVTFANGVAPFFVLELLGALTALGIGVLLSLFAENEFQAVQFIPLVITPQVILGGTFLPVEELPTYLEIPARAMPVTYLVDGMQYVVRDAGTAGDFWTATTVLGLYTLLAVVGATAAVGRAQ